MRKTVRTHTWSGDRLIINVDNDGDVGFTREGYPNFMVNPDVLRDALRKLGVISDETPATEGTGLFASLTATVDTLIDRVSALEATVAEMRRGPQEGDRYRDEDGDTWRVLADGRLQCEPGGMIRERAAVERQWGPLVPIDGAPAL